MLRRRAVADLPELYALLETGADQVVHYQEEGARDPLLAPALLPQVTRSILYVD